MVTVWWHARLWRHPRSVSLIPLVLDIALVGHSRLRIHGHVGRHVTGRQMGLLGHAWATVLGWEVLVRGLLRRFNLVAAVDAVLTAGAGLRRV